MKKLLLLMGILSFFSCSNTKKLTEQLDKIGYFDLISDSEKLKHVKEKIDFEFSNEENSYIGKSWLILPNDYYISSVHNLKEYGNNSSTSDFRAFEVWAADLYEQNVESYLKSAKVVFEKNGLKLNWSNENIKWEKESDLVETIHHTLSINGNNYVLYSGNVRDRSSTPAFDYLTNFRKILNEVLRKQESEHNIILLTAPEHVYFILLQNEMLKDFKKIIAQTNNTIEE